jgi:hypothetical protein
MVSRSEIVAALAFVWLGGAISKVGDWTVGAVSFKAGQSDAAIRELDAPPLSDIGGTVYLRVDNESLAPLIIKDAAIGGQPVDTLMHAQKAEIGGRNVESGMRIARRGVLRDDLCHERRRIAHPD